MNKCVRVCVCVFVLAVTFWWETSCVSFPLKNLLQCLKFEDGKSKKSNLVVEEALMMLFLYNVLYVVLQRKWSVSI